MANRPLPPKTQSEKQVENRMKFKSATLYAKEAMKDPAKKEFYWKKAIKLKLPNAYTAAITDYMRKVDVKKIETKAYHGKAGDSIAAHVRKKDFYIAGVSVTLLADNGEKIESGAAMRNNEGYWVYRTTVSGTGQRATRVLVVVKDQTGHITNWERNTGSESGT